MAAKWLLTTVVALAALRHAAAPGCFHGDDTVQTAGGPVRMAELAVGSRVLAYDESTGASVYSPVRHWLHREPDASAKFLQLKTDAGHALRVTPKHIIYRVPQCAIDAHAEKVPAGWLRRGDCLLTSGEGGVVSRDRLVFIRKRNDTGVYAPVTEMGTVLVQGVAASCIANERHSAIADWALWLNGLLGRLSLGGTEADGGVVRLGNVYKAALALRRWLSLDTKTVAPVPSLF